MKARQGLCAVAAIACAVGASKAQDTASIPEHPIRPEAAGREVRSFGFNKNSPTPLPIEAWYRGQSAPEQGRERPGFPVWNGAFVDHDSPAFEGAGSVKLPTQGGSTSVKLRRGVVPIFSTADYLVTAMVRTEGLSHAGAVLEAWQVDGAGREIDHSRVRSGVIRQAQGWTPVGVEILGLDSDAAFVQIELMLLQPRELAGPSAAAEPYKIWNEDYDGAAWFDAVQVHQLPRVELRTANTGNVIQRPERPALEAFVRDLAGERLSVQMTVTDLHGRPVDSFETTLDGGRLREKWEPDLPLLGWYRGVIRLRDETGKTVGGARCDFLWMDRHESAWRIGQASAVPGAGLGAPSAHEFGVEFLTLPEALITVLPEIVAASGSTAANLPAWDDQSDAAGQSRRVDRIAPAIERLLTRGTQITLGFDRVPDPLARSTGIDPLDPLSLFTREPDLWRGYTEPFLDRFGQRVRLWRIGRAGDEPISGQTAASLDSVRTELGRLVPGPMVAIPWRPERELPQDLLDHGTRLSLSLPAGLDDRAIGLLAQDWARLNRDATASRRVASVSTDSPAPKLSAPLWAGLELTLEPLPEDPFGQAAAPAELVRRAITALRHFGPAATADPDAEPVRLTLVDPVTYSGRSRTPTVPGGEAAQVSPAPALGAWAQMINALSERNVTGEITGLDGVRCYVLEPVEGASESRGGALVLWREDARTDVTTLRMNLGEGDVRAVDLFGNSRPVPRVEVGDRQRPEHLIEVGDEPQYLEGVDVGLVRFQSSIRLEPELVEARNVVHQHELVIDNPWDLPVRGRAFLLEPGGFSAPDGEVDRRWEISPRVIEFTIAALGQTRVPLSIETTAGTPSGPQPLVLDVELTASENYGTVRVRRGFELGLPELGLRVYYRVGSPGNPADLFLEAEVTNLGDRTMNLRLDSVVPGFPRGKATITGLKPGETVLRTFALPDAYDTARGLRAAVSLTDADEGNGARLIKAVTIE